MLQLLLLDNLLDGYGASGFVPLGFLVIVLNLYLLHPDGLFDGQFKEDSEALKEGLLSVVKDD